MPQKRPVPPVPLSQTASLGMVELPGSAQAFAHPWSWSALSIAPLHVPIAVDHRPTGAQRDELLALVGAVELVDVLFFK